MLLNSSCTLYTIWYSNSISRNLSWSYTNRDRYLDIYYHIAFLKIILFLYVLFLAVLGLHCYADSSLVEVHGLLIVVASVVVEHRLLSAPVLVVGACGLSRCLQLAGSEPSGLVILWHVVSSQTRDWTSVPCIARWILNHWTTRKTLISLTIFFC